MNHKCPKCQRAIYNRRLTHCGFCGAEIPKSLRFTKEEIAIADREIAELERRRRKRQLAADRKAENEEQKRRAKEITRLITGF